MSRQETSAPKMTLGALFVGFLEIAVSSFGGAVAWARRVLVERRGWFTAREFAEMLGLCQVLPGGNVMNLAVYVGARAHGAAGALVAIVGLLLAPMLIIMLLGVLYAQGAQFEAVRAALRGAAAVTASLVLANGLKLVGPYRQEPWALLVAGLAFVGVGLLRLPLIPVLLVLAPFSIALARRHLR
jgi:chromate transporter